MSSGGGPPPPTSGGFGGPENGVGSSTGQPSAVNGMISTESAIAALGQHDQLFHRQVLHIRQQQAAQQQLLQQQFNLQRQILIENQEKALKTHLLEYLDQHRRLEEAVAGRHGEVEKPNKKSDVKHKLQEFVLQKKQREIINNSNNNVGSFPVAGDEASNFKESATDSSMQYSESESTDAEVSSLLSSSTSYFKALPRISPVQEDETQPVSHFQYSPRSSRSIASPFGDLAGSLGSSSSSLLEDGRGFLQAPTPYNPSPPRHGKLRPVGRTQSAPLPLAHPSLLAPPEVRQGKTSPELEAHNIVKQQIRHSVLNRHHRIAVPGETFKSLDPMLAMAELSQMQHRCTPGDDSTVIGKARHSSTENITKGKPRPISRTRSSPLVSLGTSISPTGSSTSKKTGVAWDPVMLKHMCLCGDETSHPESPGRLERILARLAETGILNRCELIRRRATMEELKSCHSDQHVQLYGVSPLLRGSGGLGVSRLPCGGWGVDTDTVWNDIHTPTAAKIAAGSVIELVNKVGAGTLRNGLGLVRPPGHHSEHNQALGFCFFNNVAIAARQYRRLFNKRVVIFDWDIHHGNGTQQEFYSDPEVMYISIHRHDGGNFFPGTGAPEETGSAPGTGSTVNIAWSSSEQPLSDAEYLAAIRAVVIPLIKLFKPGIVIVSAGFDAAPGHPPTLGGYAVSPACFASMTSSLLQLAEGKVVLALEGGYTGPAVSESVLECLKTLLGEPAPPGVGVSRTELERMPSKQAIEDITKTIANHVPFWPQLSESSSWIACSHMQYLDHQPLDITTIRNLQV